MVVVSRHGSGKISSSHLSVSLCSILAASRRGQRQGLSQFFRLSLSLSCLLVFIFFFSFVFPFGVWSLRTGGFTFLDLLFFFFIDLHVGWLAGLLVHNFGGGSSYKVRRPNSFFCFFEN